MYLKRERSKGGYHYTLCESYREQGCWKHRRLMDLGPEPGDYIEYPGGNGFFIHESVEEEVRSKTVHFCYDDLEAIFIPFLDPYIRRIVERFQSPASSRKRWGHVSAEELFKHHRQLHSFDKRRLHYLRCGRVNIGDVDAKPWKFLNVLLEKSRDEMECFFDRMEESLPPHELRRYLYTALHLQTHFRHLLTRNQPEFLDPKKVDHYFLEDLCRLNRDETFFRGVKKHDPEKLHPYLVKYLILYFDHTFDPRLAWDEMVGDFVWRHQFYRKPRSTAGMSVSEKDACRRLGISLAGFQKMDRRELIRQFRLMAKRSHPDTGGDQESFLHIKAAYECLMRRKS
jgi:hypothetical protein